MRTSRSTDRVPPIWRPPRLDQWPDVHWTPDADAIRVDLDTLTPAIVRGWQQGDRLLLTGRMLTGRDAAHKRIRDMLDGGRAAAGRFQAAA